MTPPIQTKHLRDLKRELSGGAGSTVGRVVPSVNGQSSKAPSSEIGVTAEDANLFDFVQQECMRGLTRAVLVRTQHSEGILCFDEGQLIHAETGKLCGEDAAIFILCWRFGRIDPTSDVWVNPSTIETSWQGLLMKAAQRIDEGDRDHDSSIQTRGEKAFSNLEEFVEFRGSNLSRAVRVDSEGEVLVSHGDTKDFADAACYAVRLAELIGEGLGLDQFTGLECVTNKKVMLAYVEDEIMVAVEADPIVDLSIHRKRAGT